jgi:type IV pilus assembly protein PilA
MASRLLLPPAMGCRPKGRAGFTLVELMVVISIIGVLAAIALPTFSGRQGKGFDARVRQDARNAATGEEAYYLDTLSYFSGDCSLLPGVNISPGVSCTATTTASGFEIATSHPRATVSCVFDSAGSPNLDCNTVGP